ncbi:MAG: hypothetical protein DCC49_04630 [Acidobacteria bacterium]|nr:MAG: hypothetical protein DCC49_04630 [Acidobacteriota bacterium]
MKVALHAVAATKQGASTEVIAGTLRGLRHAAPENDYVLFLNSELDIDLPAGTSRIEARLGGAASRILWDQVSYPRLLKRIGADISIACFGFTAIRPEVPQVVILQNALYFCGIPKTSPYASQRSLRLERWLLHRIVRSANSVVVPSQTMADGVRPWLSHSSGGAIVIPDAWEYEVSDVMTRSWSEPWKLVYIAHLERHKAHLELIDIASELRRRGRRAVFSIGIDEKDEPEIYAAFTRRMAEEDLADWFDVSGRVPRAAVTKKMLAADCFISPTKCESFGYSYLEATGAGLPVVSSDIPIAREMLGDGALFYRDASKAADQIERLSAEPSLGVELAEKARSHQKLWTLTWEEYGERLATVISSLSSSPR